MGALEGHLLIVTCNQFSIGKWSEVSEATSKDHDQIEYLLTHEFIGKINPENVHSLKNPSTNEFRETLSLLKKRCKESSYLVIYIATHVVKVIKGEKENPKEKTYFAFNNSVWGKQNEIAESSISLSMFCTLLNKISCSHKTIIMNYAHQPAPRTVLFPSSKVIYPSSDFISKLSERSKCVVIGCCSIGTKAKDYLLHSEYHIQEITPITPVNTGIQTTSSHQQAKPSHIHYPTLFNTFHNANTLLYNKMLSELMKEWGIAAFPEVKRSVRPVKPSATWEREEGTLNVTLPDQKQRNNYTQRLIYWKVKRALAKPKNFAMEQYRAHLRNAFCAPCQTSIVDPREPEYSIFGRAIVNALRGGAYKPHSKVVTALDLYTFMHAYMGKHIERLNAQNLAEYSPESEQPAPVPVYQSPILFIPYGQSDLARNPVCYKCEPPAAPDKPYIIRIGNNEVLLEWYNPSFDGVPPVKYRLAMKNETRNFNTWSDIYYPGEITKNRFLVRNLPMGIACQFRVAAYNNGGWGDYSEATTFAVPGEQNEVLPASLRWKRLRQGGALAVLDRLESHWYCLAEYTVGLRLLMGIGQNGYGFKNTATTMRVATVALKALHTYPMDEDVATHSFTLLGICLRGVKYERKVRQLCLQNHIVETVERNMKYFRRNARVMGGISFIRGGMQKYLPSDIEQDLSTLIPPPPGEDEDEVEEEEDVIYEEDEEEDNVDEVL